MLTSQKKEKEGDFQHIYDLVNVFYCIREQMVFFEAINFQCCDIGNILKYVGKRYLTSDIFVHLSKP